MDRGELLGDTEMIGHRQGAPGAEGVRRTATSWMAFHGPVRQGRRAGPDADSEPLVIDLAVPDGELLSRMQTRRRVQQVRRDSPSRDPSRDACERCGGTMITRADDSDEQVRQHRLDVYAAREQAVCSTTIAGRPTFRSINGAQAPDQVAKELAAQIEEMVTVTSRKRS
jgi:hypothetical protein